jgi:hypothetical protein
MRLSPVRNAVPGRWPADPATSPLYHTVVHRACKHAHGTTTEQNATNGIWNYIKGMVVQNYANQPENGFGYWRNVPPDCWWTQCLLDTPFDGRCGAWAQFMRDVLHVHGIHATRNEIVLRQKAFPNEVGGFPATAGGVFIKNYTFPNAPLGPAVGQNGIAGQGAVGNPTSFFTNHAVTVVNGAVYDPSYGRGPFTHADPMESLREWQIDVVAAFRLIMHMPEGDVETFVTNKGIDWNRFVEWGLIEP